MASHSKRDRDRQYRTRRHSRWARVQPRMLSRACPVLERLEGRICLSDVVGLSSSANPSLPGELMTFGVMVIPLSPGPAPTGTVQYQVDGTNFGTPVSLADGAATSGPDPSLSVGTHTITAIYSGDGTYPGQTVTMTQTVESPSQVTGNVYTVTSLGDTATGSGVPGDLRYALTQADANPGSVVDFSVMGTIHLDQALPAISADTTLNGPGPSLLTLEGGGPSSNFTVLEVDASITATISGLTITGGNNTNDDGRHSEAGGLYNAGTLALADCSIEGNSAVWGAGVECSGPGASLTITDCTVSGNSASYAIGGVFASSPVTMSDSSIFGNNAGGTGGFPGGIEGYLTASDCSISQNTQSQPGSGGASGGVLTFAGSTLTDCLLSGNTGSDGGAIYILGTTALTNCTLSGNTATADGGALSGRYTATLTNCDFLNNTAYEGGAIGAGTALTLTGCTFTGNSAKSDGGAIDVNAAASLTDCTISGNTANEGGGLFSSSESAPIELASCTLSDNTATEGGGGIMSGASLTLSGCTLSENTATVEGGGILNIYSLTLSECTISGNAAHQGAGLSNRIFERQKTGYGGSTSNFYYPAVAIATNCTLTGNTATSYGGGILNQGTLKLTECTLSGNMAKFGAGLDDLKGAVGQNLYQVATAATLNYCSLSGNSAAWFGGGIMNEGVLDLAHCTISGDTAGHVGGGLANISLSFFYSYQYSPPVATATLTNSTLYGNTSLYGGAIDNEAARVTLTNDTLTANLTTGTSPYAAALTSISSFYDLGDLLLNNTLVAGNLKGASPSTAPGDVAALLDSKSAFNLIGDGDLLKGISNGTDGNQIGSASAGTVIDPDLGPLASNGGPTQTVAELAGSPAIDAGSTALAVDPATGQALVWDQRGSGYARIVNNTVDIGAFEYAAFLVIPTQLVPTPPPPSPMAVTSSLSLTVTAEDDSGNTALAFDSAVTLTIASGPTGGTLTGTLTETALYGVASFSGLNFNEPGSYTLTVSGGGLSGTIGPIQVVAGPAVQLVITTEPPADVVAGAEFQLVVADEDSLGFVNTSYSGSATVALIDNPGNATLGGTLTVTFQSGVATFSNLSLGAAADGYLLQVTSGNLVPATTSAVDVIAVQLAIATQPPSSVSAGTGFSLVVNADTSGQLDSSFDGTVTVSLVNPPAGVALGGTLSATASGGVATFSGLTLDKAAPGYSLSIASSGLSTITSNVITVTPAVASQWVILTQPSSTATAGQPFAAQPVVDEEDRFGNLETGDNTTVVSVVPQGGTGALQGTTSVTVKGGVATFTNLADDDAQTISLDFSGGGLTGAISSSIVVSPAAASRWVIQAQPSSTATAGQAFAAQPVVDEEDQFGNLETEDSRTVVSAKLASGAGPLLGTVTATVTAGVATFTNLADATAGTITLEFTGDGLSSDPSNPIVISPAAPSQLVIQTQPSPTGTAGNPLATQPVIDEEDQYGNLETGDNSTVITASPSTGSAQLAGATATVSGGVATFADFTDDTAGTIALTFSGGGLSAGPSSNITVSPAAASQLVIDVQPSATATAGQSLAAQPVLYEEDQFGNVETGDSSTVITAAPAAGSARLTGATATVANGVATFTGLTIDTAGAVSLVFKGGGLNSAASHSIAVSPAAASQLVIQVQPSSNATAGQPFATQPVVDEEDQYGNIEAGDDTTVVTVSLASGAGPLLGPSTATVAEGVATFTGLTDDTAETVTLEFTSGSLTAATTNSVVISPAAPSALVIHTQPSATATAGQSFATQPVIDEEDSYGNLETSDNTTVITAAASTGSAQLTGASATVRGGVATFANLADDTAGTIALEFQGGGLTVGPSNSLSVTPAAASQLVIQVQPSGTAIAGQDLATQPVINEEDQYGNLETGDNSTVITAAPSAGSAQLEGATATVVSGVATFTGLADDTAGSITLTFSGGGLTIGPSSSVIVAPAAASQLVIHTQPSSSAVAGQTLATEPVIYEEDAYGNVETGDDSSVITAAASTGSAQLTGVSVTVNGGVATFTGLAVDTAGTVAFSFSSGGLTIGPSSSVIVAPAAASQLVIHTQPSSSAVAGQTLVTEPVIYEEDAYGNVETGDDGSVITAAASTGTAQLTGTSVTVNGGVATFIGLADDTAGTIALTFSGGGLKIGPSSSVLVSPAAASQLVIDIQPSRTATAGQALTTQPVIYEEDVYGNLETGDDTTVITASPSTGTAQLVGAGITMNGGIATFTDLADDTAGTTAFNFSGGGLTTGPSRSLEVSPAAASQWVISVPPSATATAGQALAIQPVVDEEDQYGNLETRDNSTVVTAASTGVAEVLGTTATVKGGVATFTDLTLNTAGSIALEFSGEGLNAATTDPISVSPATAALLVIQTQPSAQATAGVPFAVQPVVDEEDAYGNLETGDDTTTITVALASGAGSLQGATPVRVTDGVATFAGLACDTARTIALEFAASGLTGTTEPIDISPAAASQLVISSQPSTSATAGQVLAIQPVIEEEDAFGNLETGDDSTVITANPSTGSAQISGTSVTVKAGIATFTGLADDTAGSVAFDFSGGGLTTGPSNGVVISPAAPSQWVVHIEPSSSAVAGQALAAQPVVYEEDRYGNLETDDNTTMVTASPATKTGQLTDATATVMGGIATFTGLAVDTAGTSAIQFTGDGLTAATTNPITVAAGPATQLVVTAPPPSGVVAGTTFAMEVEAEDAFGNLATTFNGPVTVGAGGDTLGGTTTVTAVGGVASFSELTLGPASGPVALQAAGNGLADATTSPVSVAAPAQLAFAVGSVTVNEDAGDAMIQVVRTGGDSAAVSVSVATSGGTAVAGVNYTPVDEVLSFAAGQDSQTITIPVLNAAAMMSDLTVDVILSSPGVGAVLGSPATTTLVIHNPNEGGASAPLVTMDQVQLVLNKKRRVTEILVGFTGGVDAGEADSTMTYRLSIAGKRHSPTARNARTIRLGSATYDGATNTVVLRPASAFALTKPVQLIIYGTGPNALQDSYGRLIDGDDTGQPGSNAVVTLSRGGTTIASESLAADVVDLLLSSGDMIMLASRGRK